MRQRSMIMNIVVGIGLLLAGSLVLSSILGLLSGLLWFALKFMIPVAIAVWLVRRISGTPNNCRKYY